MNLMPLYLSQIPFYVLLAGAAGRKYAHKNGCRPLLHSISPGFLGLGMLKVMLTAARENRFLECVRSYHRAYGQTFEATITGRALIFTVEPRNIQTVLADKFKDFELGDYRKKALLPLLGHGIFASDGETWQRSRALLLPSFVPNQITNVDLYERHVAKLIEHIPSDGSMVDLQDLFFQMTLDSATEFFFGESVSSITDAGSTSASSFTDNFKIAQDGLALRSRIGPLMPFYRDKRFFKAVVEARRYANMFVTKAINHRASLDRAEDNQKKPHKLAEKPYVFLYELLKQTSNETELTDQLLNMLLAGRDTTASLLSITFFILAREPDVWNRLRAEVQKLGRRKPSYEELHSMTYLTWVLNETLRLYPIVPFNVRMANKDTFLPVGGGPDGKYPVYVAKGQEVIYSVYTMHRLPEIFGSDADVYRPERWETLKPGWAYLPFNGGPRICIGQQFALTEASYATVRILQHFNAIESRDLMPFQERLTLTMASYNGTKVALTPVDAT
ncbi:hypothetical protein OIDMADRAFT_105115 [Oidiodendron maius Zn]|uniref:Cytochrome P450 n=1 Tax=Oidiodendron maius (strain Zn) TaxID=913774 RepID=A0A0C3D9M6_OIDMZ|nr:hypothetical protein OIDMADRAFT_105115 [Oidiodendron maius Zn]